MSWSSQFDMVPPRSNLTVRERLNFSRLALSFPKITIGFWLAVVVAGFMAFSSLQYALFPDITFPVVIVDARQTPPTTETTATETTATAQPVTALQTEDQLTQPLEKRLKTLENLDGIRSTTYPGRSVLTLSFRVGQDLETSEKAVEAALQGPALPKADWKVLPFNLNESPAISYAIRAKAGQTLPQVVQTVQEKVVPVLEKLPGVLKVEVLGGPETAGAKTTTTPETTTADETPTLVRFNGENAIAVRVVKKAEANTLQVVSQVETEIRQLRPRLADLKVEVSATQARFIREATQATLEDLGMALALAVLIIFPFLWNWRATLIAALAIPISLLGTFIVMAIAGFNLETITLLALALVIGIVIDDAIVDVENMSRHIEEGESPRQAALTATAEIGLTVISATLTIVAVFLPVGLMGGTIGQFFKPFGLTVSAAVTISLLVSRTLTPVLGAMWLKRPQAQSDGRPTRRDDAAWWQALLQGYHCLLQWSLNHRRWVMGLAIASFVAGLALIPFVPQGFIPKLDRGEFNVGYTISSSRLQSGLQQKLVQAGQTQLLASLPPGALQDYTVQSGDTWTTLATQFTGSPDAASPVASPLALLNGQTPENRLTPGQIIQLPADPSLLSALAPQDNGAPAQPSPTEINRLSLDLSRDIATQIEQSLRQNPAVESVFTVMGERGAIHQGRLYVRLKSDRQAHTAVIQDQVRQAMPNLSDVAVSIEDIQFVDTGGEKPVQVALQGNDLPQLLTTADQIADRIRQKPGFVDVTATGDGRKGDVIESIERKDGLRTVYISANLSQGQALGEATDTVVAEAKALAPSGVTIDLGGDSARSSSVLGSFGTTLSLSLGAILFVLILLFRRILDPLVVMFSLPLSIVGAMVGLLVTQSDFGMIAVIGMILLMGLANKNAILIIDYVNQLRAEGTSREDALLKAGPVRLRPIMMTTLSTILGMLPIALGLGAGAELRQPLAVAVMGGLITSSLLSLIVVPVLYTLFDDVQRWFGKQLRVTSSR